MTGVEIQTPEQLAAAMGHDVIVDPPSALSRAERWTCRTCGCAVIRYGTNVYGSATTTRCTTRRTAAEILDKLEADGIVRTRCVDCGNPFTDPAYGEGEDGRCRPCTIGAQLLDGTKCVQVSEAWGPHPGCKEFMTEPDTWTCTATATHLVSWLDFDGHEQFEVTMPMCAGHAFDALLLNAGPSPYGESKACVRLIEKAVTS